MPRNVLRIVPVLVAVTMLATPALAQDMSASDITRMQQTADQIGADLVKLRARDRAAARSLQDELSDLDDEVIYLKVKLRREGVVSRADYMDVRDRLENLRERANGSDSSSGRYSTGGSTSTDSSRDRSRTPGTIPAGTELDIRLSTALNSATSQVEDRVEGTTLVDLRENGQVVIPAGSRVRGVVTAVKKAGRVERKGSVAVSFEQITINQRTYPIRGSVTQALESGGYRDDVEKIGAGAAVGGIIGGIIGGVKGAIAGVLIGGGGVVAATDGQDVELTPGAVLRMRLDDPLTVSSTLSRQ